MANLIAVTGATGFLGGRVAHLLAERELPQRLVVRDASRAPTLPGATTVGGVSYGDFEAMRSALTGVQTLLFVSATRGGEPGGRAPQRGRRGRRRRCRADRLHLVPRCGTRVHSPSGGTTRRPRSYIRAAGIPYTFLRDNLYLDVLPYFPGPDGVIRGPAGNGRFGGVARDDVADSHRRSRSPRPGMTASPTT